MKSHLFTSFTLIFVLISCVFAPYLVIASNTYSFVEFFKNFAFLPEFLLLVLPYFLFLVASILVTFKEKQKWFNPLLFLLFIMAAVLLLFSKSVVVTALPSLKDEVSFSTSPFLLSFVALCCAIYFIRKSFDGYKLAIRDMVEIAIFVSFAVILDFPVFKIRIGANGGSISFAMVPLAIICLRKGFIKGFFATGLVYGLITCLTDGYGIAYFPFDYLLGFGSIAILGLFKNVIFSKTKLQNYILLFISMCLVFVFRTAASTISGILYFKVNFVESLVYQLLYVGPSSAICLALLILLHKPLCSINKRFAS